MSLGKNIFIALLALFIFVPAAFAKVDIAIIGAMDCEIKYFNDKLIHKKTTVKRNLVILQGEIGKNSVAVVRSGVGKVNAAATTQFIIDEFSPKYIVNTGVSGALSPYLKIGDVMVASALVQHDFDVTALGAVRGAMDKDNPKKVTYYYTDKNLNDLIVAANKKVDIGIIASGDIFISDWDKRKALRKEFNADMVEMEGAAIAQVATLNKIPYTVLRVSSDMASSADSEYFEFKDEMALYCSEIIYNVLKDNKL